LTKPFPYSFRKTTYGESYHENGRDAEGSFAFDDELFPGGWSDLTTSMNGEFALGTASLPYVNAGHADSLVVRMRRSERVQSLSDFRSMTTRGVYNGARPGQRNHSHVSGAEIDASYLYEEGRCATYQHENRAIVHYAPKRAGHRRVSSFRTDLLITYAAPFDRLVVNGQPARLPVDLPQNARILFEDYHTFGAIVLLDVEPQASSTPVRLWECNGYLLISAFNYEGQPRDFTREEIARWRSGFILDLAAREEVASFADFSARVEAMTVFEEIGPDAIRTTTVEDSSGKMEFCNDPLREMILYRRWNGTDDTVEHLSVDCPDTSGVYAPQTLFGQGRFESGAP
jgi:hypothetical protein